MNQKRPTAPADVGPFRYEHRSHSRTVPFASDAAYWRDVGATIDAFVDEMTDRATREQRAASAAHAGPGPDRVDMHIHVESSGPGETDDGRPRVHMRMDWRIQVQPDPEPFVAI